MSVLDIAHEITPAYMAQFNVSSDTTILSGLKIDTSDANSGFFITAFASSYTDGDYEITILESDQQGSGFVDVPSQKLISSNGNGNIIINSESVVGTEQQTLGAFSNDKFIQAKVVSTNVTSGAVIEIFMTKMKDNRPYTN